MRLHTLLPRPLGVSDSDCASLFTSLIMSAHLERSRARSLGWRGVRPSASPHPAWTCRVAGSDHVFGIRFEGEEQSPPSSPIRVRGSFSLFVFPRAESPILDIFPLAALRFALSPAYDDAVRDFSGNEPELAPFCLGALRLDAALAGDALALTLEAPARRRIAAADGIAAEDGWLVAPGAPECDVPAFRLFLRLFAVLAGTAEHELGEKAVVSRGMTSAPRLSVRSDGRVEEIPDEKESILNITASFGPPQALEGEALRPMRAVPARYRPKQRDDASLPVLHVLTGFLGAGKTTFLRRWLDFLHGRERFTGVIQNEFGSVELDAALMKDDTLVEALDDGCVCCSLADSLRPGIERIIAAMPARQFVLETTGLANPANIMEALSKLRDLVRPGLVITVADALDLRGAGRGEEAARPESEGIRHAQLRAADVIILNKSDMVPPEVLDEVTARLRAINRRAAVIPAGYGNIRFAQLDALMDALDESRLPSPQLLRMGEQPVTHAAEGYLARTVAFDAPVSRAGLAELLRGIGPGLCRAKGILVLEGEGACIVQYAAGQLEVTPAAGAEPTDLVLIGVGTGMDTPPRIPHSRLSSHPSHSSPHSCGEDA